MDVAEAADKLAAAAREVSEAWDECAGDVRKPRWIHALVALDEAEEGYTFIRRERKVQAER